MEFDYEKKKATEILNLLGRALLGERIIAIHINTLGDILLLIWKIITADV